MIFFLQFGYGQLLEPRHLKPGFSMLLRETPDFFFRFNKNEPFRYSSLRYYPTKIHDLHVISVAQPNMMFDNTYFIDANGKTVYRSIGLTAPMNRYHNSGGYDSFNPTGARTLKDAVVQGIWDSFFVFKK